MWPLLLLIFVKVTRAALVIKENLIARRKTMSQYIENLTSSLTSLIDELAQNPCLFLKNPQSDFTRVRKIDFGKFVGITMNSGGCTMSKELLDYFDFDVNTPSVSAYTQQRSKVLPEAFEFIFQSFTKDNLPSENLYQGYRLLACDGSNLSIANNPNDRETLRKKNQYGDNTSNHLHLNALYDVLNRVYVDALVQKYVDNHEPQACISMMNRSALDKVILIADRNYESYNIMAHAINKNWNYVIRVKDLHSNGIASTLDLPDKDTFDVDITLTFTRKQTKAAKEAGYRFMPQNQVFDFLPPKSNGTYALSYRIVRFPITDDTYEMLVTNLDRFNFPISKLKEIYNLRWGIETSFRELKYAIGLTSFHARKVDYIKQEIFARLTLFNYCELITSHVVEKMKDKDNTKQVNFTIAIYICREFLRHKKQLSPPDVIKLIQKYTLPLSPGRKDPRKVKAQTSVSFLYRVA